MQYDRTLIYILFIGLFLGVSLTTFLSWSETTYFSMHPLLLPIFFLLSVLLFLIVVNDNLSSSTRVKLAFVIAYSFLANIIHIALLYPGLTGDLAYHLAIERTWDKFGTHYMLLGLPGAHVSVLQGFFNRLYIFQRGAAQYGLTVSLAKIDISPDNYIANLNLQTGKYLRLEVSDTGTGIEKSKLERIYEPYFTTKPKGEGTGFGLSVVHGIVTSHGGHITVYSEPGKGTTFHLYLPVIIKYQAADEPRLAEEVTGGTERILLVDDDETIGSMAKKQLESLGYQVIMLTSGVEAAETFYKAPKDFDLVVTDMTMPNMTGAELSQEFLKIRPDIPIILCSGFSELIDKDKAIDIGIQEYLIKPISRKDLAWAVRKALDKK